MNITEIGKHSFSGYLANQLATQFSDNMSKQATNQRTRVAQITCPKEIICFVAISALSLLEGLFRMPVVTAKQVVKHSIRYFRSQEKRVIYVSPFNTLSLRVLVFQYFV